MRYINLPLTLTLTLTKPVIFKRNMLTLFKSVRVNYYNETVRTMDGVIIVLQCVKRD